MLLSGLVFEIRIMILTKANEAFRPFVNKQETVKNNKQELLNQGLKKKLYKNKIKKENDYKKILKFILQSFNEPFTFFLSRCLCVKLHNYVI